MSPEIVAVLVVPVEGDPGGLLAECALWSDQPAIGEGRPIHYFVTPGLPPSVTGVRLRFPTALPLWWDGALVPEGWDRARRAMPRKAFGVGATLLLTLNPGEESPGDAEIVAHDLVAAGLASRVVRLTRVNDRLVEVTP